MTEKTRPPQPAGAQQGSKRWMLYALLFLLGWIMMYADRSILSPVQPQVAEQFGLNNAQVGLVSSVFFFVYVGAQVPSGILGDRVGRIKLIFIGFMIFGLATMLTGVMGLLHFFGLFMLMRAFAGLGEGLYYGPQYAKSGEETPLKHRALGAAIINSGQGFGIAIGITAATWMTFTKGWGWPWAFVTFGVLTLIVGLMIKFGIPDSKPQREPQSLKVELSRFGSLLKSPTLLGVFLMLFCGVYTFFVMVTWLPTFLSRQWDLPSGQAGNLASLAFWVAIPAGILMGFLSDRVRRRRLFVIVLVPIAIASMLILAFAPSIAFVTLGIVLFGLFGKLALDPVLISSVADNVSNDLRSTAYGLYNFVGMAAAILAPPVTGALVDATGTFRSAFILAAGLLAVGMVVFLLTFRENSTPIGPREESEGLIAPTAR